MWSALYVRAHRGLKFNCEIDHLKPIVVLIRCAKVSATGAWSRSISIDNGKLSFASILSFQCYRKSITQRRSGLSAIEWIISIRCACARKTDERQGADVSSTNCSQPRAACINHSARAVRQLHSSQRITAYDCYRYKQRVESHIRATLPTCCFQTNRLSVVERITHGALCTYTRA